MNLSKMNGRMQQDVCAAMIAALDTAGARTPAGVTDPATAHSGAGVMAVLQVTVVSAAMDPDGVTVPIPGGHVVIDEFVPHDLLNDDVEAGAGYGGGTGSGNGTAYGTGYGRGSGFIEINGWGDGLGDGFGTGTGAGIGRGSSTENKCL